MITKKNPSQEITPIFAYLRRSTKKKEQALSLVQQEEGIYVIAEYLGIDLKNIESYAETKSGFENKTRPVWNDMMKAIDKLKTPCILLARDTSRLSRNQKDNLEICDRLYGDNGHKIKIEKIYFLGKNLEVLEWNNKTNKIALTDKLKSNYNESLETKEKSITGILLKLSNGEFPYAAPKGLSNFKNGDERILKQNDLMPFVIRAFEMKTEGKSHKEISKFLLNSAGIRIGERDLTDRLFRNPVYIGEYTEKTTIKYFTGLKFAEGKPPISRILWDKVQKCLGRKMSQYGEKQEGHLMEAKIKSESGHLFSKYLAKQKYPTYKGKFKDTSGKEEFIHISEAQILDSFMKVLGDILDGFNKKFFNIYDGLITATSVEVMGYEKEGEYNIDIPSISEKHGDKNALLPMKGGKIFIDAVDEALRTSDMTPVLELNKKYRVKKDKVGKTLAIQKISDVLKMQFNEDTKDFRNAKEIQINKFQKQKEEIEQERKNYRREALKMGYNREEIEETTKDMDDTIKLIESQIIELSDNTDMEKYLEKLPEVLLKTVELASNTINRANLEGLREDIKLLLEITTVELTVTNKKELKVKLFDVLDKLVSSDNFNLERLSRKVRTTQILLYTKNYVSIPIHSKIVKENNRGLWKTRVEIV